MSLYTGVVREQAGDYFGPPVNRAARLLSAGHGGQTLLSLPTKELVRDALPAQVTLRDMGEHNLKDLFRPEHIFQLQIPGVPGEFPPLNTLNSRPNNFPIQPTPLIGREPELVAVTDLLSRDDVRLLTLTGTGGTGKTRLALQAAADILDDFRDGSWFVDLATITDPGRLIPTVTATLGVSESAASPIADTLREYLKGRVLLLVLDNFEQIVDAAPDVGTLMAACPNLKLLVTSRVPLRLRGEHEYPVPPLTLPNLLNLPAPEHLSQYEAVRLFIERAEAVRPDFVVDNNNAAALAEICYRLDGLPLAIELAASRIRLLTPHAMLARLQSRLKLLTGGARDLPARHQTLRAAIEWSYDLLDGAEKTLFRRLAVFSGGRTLPAIDAVCNAGSDLGVDVLDGVESLVSKSLLRQEHGSDGEPRFMMLETIHEYARECLEASGEAADSRRLHALYFLALAEEAEPHVRGSRQLEWLDRLDDEQDNLRAALDWSRQEALSASPANSEPLPPVEVGLRLLAALYRYWVTRSVFTEGRQRMQSILDLDTAKGGPSKLRAARARALLGASLLANRQADYSTGKACAEEALALSQDLDSNQLIGSSSLALSVYTPDKEARLNLLERSRALFEATSDTWNLARVVYQFGLMAGRENNITLSSDYLVQAMTLAKKAGDNAATAHFLTDVANIDIALRDYASARLYFGQAQEVFSQVHDRWGVAVVQSSLVRLAWIESDPLTIRHLAEEALEAFRDAGDELTIAALLLDLARMSLLAGYIEEARSLSTEALQISEHAEHHNYLKGLVLRFHGHLAKLDGNTSKAAELYGESLRFGLAELEYLEVGPLLGAAAIAAIAALADPAAEPERVSTLLGATQVLGELGNQPLDYDERIIYERTLAAARPHLDEAAWQAAWDRGAAMTLEEAVAYALGSDEPAPTRDGPLASG